VSSRSSRGSWKVSQVVLAVALGVSVSAAGPDVPAPDGTTALHRAVSVNDAQKSEGLIRAGANVNAANRYGVTPLSLAAANGNARLLDLLIMSGASPKTADASLREGRTLLMLAARTGNAEAVSLLLAHDGAVNVAESRTGTTALMWAASENRADVVRALVAAGADVNARSKVTAYPHTPPGVIGDALEDGYSYVGQTVLPRGGWTALMYAARQGGLDAARALAECGADLNAQDPDGTPAITLAIINGRYDVAEQPVPTGERSAAAIVALGQCRHRPEPDAVVTGECHLHVPAERHAPARSQPQRSCQRCAARSEVRQSHRSGLRRQHAHAGLRA